MVRLISDYRERERFLRFLVVGLIGAVVDFGTFNLITRFFNIQAVVASVISFSAAVVSNFIWNRFWTYPDSRSKSISSQMAEFTLISLIGLVIRTPLFAALEHPLIEMFSDIHLQSISGIDATFLGHNLALAVAVVVVMFWNFFVNRYWTYADVD